MNATPLVTASYMGREKIVRFLIGIGLDPNAECMFELASAARPESIDRWPVDYKYSTLEIACLSGNGEVVRALLDAGATTRSISEASKRPEHNWDAQWVAVSKGSSACIKVLLDHGIRLRRANLLYAIQEGMEGLVASLIEYGIPVSDAAAVCKQEINSQGGEKRSAARRFCLELLVLGLEGLAMYEWDAVFDLDKTTKGNNGTLLHTIEPNAALATRLLIQAGAVVDATNSNGETPLMLAAQRGNDLVVKELLSSGASKHAQDNNGQSAVQYALEKGVKATIEHLMSDQYAWHRFDD